MLLFDSGDYFVEYFDICSEVQRRLKSTSKNIMMFCLAKYVHLDSRIHERLIEEVVSMLS